MKILHPIPDQVKLLMTDPNETLESLDKYLNPGTEGTIFHNYSAKILNKLKSVGINSFIDLKTEFDLIQDKKSRLTSQFRKLVLGHYNFYVSEFESVVNYYNTLTQDQINAITDNYYVEEKDDNMKLNLIKINQSVQDTGSVVISKDAIINDMNVIYEHYRNDKLQAPESLRPLIDDYDPIKFGTEYLSLMLGCRFNVIEDGENLKFIK